MHYRLRFLLFGISFFSLNGYAQLKPLYSTEQRQKLQNTQQSIEDRYRALTAQLQTLARQNNWPLRRDFSDGRVMILSGVSETGEPLYDITTTNRGAALTTRTDALYEGGGLGLNLTGGSAPMKNRLGIWDGGMVLSNHAELFGRVVQSDGATTVSTHATHVSGTMIATGLNPRARGMANQATLLAYDFNNDTPEMANAADNLLVSNHSYGTLSGWRLNADRPGTDNNLKWEWYGDSTVNGQQDYKFGFYDTRTREWDRITYNAPYYLPVSSAGNDRGTNGPPAGTPYFLGSSNRKSTTPRAAQNGYDLISTYNGAKNSLTVGAISVLTNGYNQLSDPRISSFSSWGPTDDGRIKPDIVGVGVSVFSTTSTNANAYATLSGTSMATPNVSGSIFLLQELYNNLKGTFMRSSTLKGLVLHTADDAGNPGPDYQYGWGLLNDRRAAEVLLNKDQSHLIAERTLSPNETYTTQVIASGKGPLVATICWTDPEAPVFPITAANFNNRTPKLVNDLDIRISDGTTTSLPWVLDPDQPANNATRGDNIRDNIEQILIANAIPGKTYTITVRHKGSLTNNTQQYALIVSGIGGKAYCESRATSDADTKITKVVLGNITQSANSGCQTYSDFMNQIATVSAGQSIPLEVTLGSCGGDFGKVVKTFIDWNADGDFDDAGETVAASAVINNGVFSAAISVPSGITVNHTARVRVVAVETTNPEVVSACGTYAKGETQELLVRFARPLRDVSLSALVSPENNFCGNQLGSITVRVRNNGTEAQSNIPVFVQVSETSGKVAGTVSSTISPSLAAFSETTVSLTAPFLSELKTGVSYQFITKTLLPNDQDTLNNTLVQTRTVAALTSITSANATYCGTDPLSLITRGNGTAFWYDSPTSTQPLAIGNSTSSSVRLPGGTFYVSLNDFSGTVGPTTKSAFSGGTYSGNFGPSPLIRTEIPLLLESARLYISSAGRLTFTVSGLNDRFVSTTTIDVVPTRNANAPNQGAPSGQVADDPNDPGQVYPLNLAIPTAGDYKITIEYENGATIFRSNAGVTGFPFRIPNIITLRGALFNQNSGTDTLTNAYYYFYDLKVKSLGCSSSRIPVVAQTAAASSPSISFTGSTAICEGTNLSLSAPANGGVYQWFFNNQPISGATRATFAATNAGNYTVSTSINNCLPSLSSPVTITTKSAEKPVITVNGMQLTSNAVSNHQWLLNGLSIPGAASSTYVALQTGNYSVRGNVNGCGELTSDEVRITITALAPTSPEESRFYPNPSENFVVCEYNPTVSVSRRVTASLYDLNGRLILKQEMEGTGNKFRTQFNLRSMQSGTFFAIIEVEGTPTRIINSILKH
ncbi:S8 family serine peptidase [Runella slithyformis]|uniref:Peptidase S8 and S53 subtilisin kexin sedolisin n=1 Tax=Runella slithyformis (strain ATCC 29530 / DSM 19594 / LMG 11500 / NCIMB 11436 / LSU 4) TaxID=761193 RepID=A0A7U4E5H2_RUNSL|nr:S8 family serine peptidase [Runella slithyformis]AEI48581.1 peptidase S8 and S53 subtilisin kexin sedolisin [Runella slithyformis DSM 19594]